MTALEALGIFSSVMTVYDLGPFGKRIYDRRTDAVQTAGNFVAVSAEFTAGVQYRKDDLQRRNAHFRVNTRRDAASVVFYRDRIVLVDRNNDLVAYARKSFVDRVVHDFIDQMMQTARRGRTDVHTRPLAHRFQALENLNLTVVVFVHRLVHIRVRKLYFTVLRHKVLVFVFKHLYLSFLHPDKGNIFTPTVGVAAKYEF